MATLMEEIMVNETLLTNREQLEELIAYPTKLRAYCLENKINAFNFFMNLKDSSEDEEKITTLKTIDISHNLDDEKERIYWKGSRSKRVTNIGAAVRAVISDFRTDYKENKKVFYFNDVVNAFKKICEDNSVKPNSSLSLEGQVAIELYHFSQKQKELEGMCSSRISIGELNHLLGFSMNETKECIVGRLSEEYVLKNYPIVDGHIVFRDANNDIIYHPSIDGVKSWDGEAKKTTREILSNFVKKYLLLEDNSNRRLQYVGLEGPNFRSYLDLAKLGKENGFDIDGLFIENNNRSMNLMKSIAWVHREEFFKKFFLEGDINDLAILDFPKDRLKLSKGSNGEINVRYGGERIPLKDYYLFTRSLFRDSMTERNSKAYGVSKEFLDAIVNRFKGKFDIVFLDYMGGPSSKKYNTLKIIANNRLRDKAIIAVSYNIAPRVNPYERGGELNNIEDKLLDKAEEIFSSVGFNLLDFDTKSYKDSSDEMCFQVYSLKRW